MDWRKIKRQRHAPYPIPDWRNIYLQRPTAIIACLHNKQQCATQPQTIAERAAVVHSVAGIRSHELHVQLAMDINISTANSLSPATCSELL